MSVGAGVVVVEGVDELGDGDPVATGSLPSSAQPAPATSRSATVAEIVRLRTFVIPESLFLPEPLAWEGHERRRGTTPSVDHVLFRHRFT